MSSVPEQLKELIDMLEKGYITREEFEEQKTLLFAKSRELAEQPPGDPSRANEVGAYRLVALIGEGGMGAVYRGRHRSRTMAERQGGDVAVKVMHPQYAKNPAYRDRFEREASLGIKLDHPGIVKVHDLVVDGGNLALVMEFVDGRPMSDTIGEAVGPIPWGRAWPLFRKLLMAVGHAHGQEVVHRDIKPDNILITADGEPHVIDFGIAKDLDTSGTRTGTGMGTVEYMAPEQYTDAKAVDRRADIYSLGMILYEMLAGRLPWDADAPQFEILEQKARKQLMSPSVYCADIPPQIVAALSPALAAKPGERPATTAAFAGALDDATARAGQQPRTERRRQTEAHGRATAGPEPSEAPDRDSFKKLARATAPGARVPCPICEVSVTGQNLVRHFDKVHATRATNETGNARTTRSPEPARKAPADPTGPPKRKHYFATVEDTYSRDKIKRLAREAGGDTLACPICGTRVSRKNLVRHYDKCHVTPASPSARPAPSSSSPVKTTPRPRPRPRQKKNWLEQLLDKL